MNEHTFDVTAKLLGRFFYRYAKFDKEQAQKDAVSRIVQALAQAPLTEGDFLIDAMQIDLNQEDELDEETPFGSICETLEDLYNRKNADYGNSYEKQLDADGLLVAKIRLNDKIGRFGTLINKKAQVDDEKLEDTLMDLASYSIMTLMWMAKQSSNETN